jgi:RNA polymerase sigma-70 factor (ECF subfamily)
MAYGTAVRLTGNRAEAEDLIQDASLLAFRAFDSFERGTNFKAWYFKILINAFYSRHRKEKHDRANLSTDEVPPRLPLRPDSRGGAPRRDRDFRRRLPPSLSSPAPGT